MDFSTFLYLRELVDELYGEGSITHDAFVEITTATINHLEDPKAEAEELETVLEDMPQGDTLQ